MLGIHKGVDTGRESMVKQSFADETDINKIIAGYEKSGMIQHLNEREPFYGDVSDMVDYQHCLNVVNEANDLFMNMDARIRERFANDPARMVAFLNDPKNIQEAISLGMAVERPKEVKQVVEDQPVETEMAFKGPQKAHTASKPHHKGSKDHDSE